MKTEVFDSYEAYQKAYTLQTDLEQKKEPSPYEAKADKLFEEVRELEKAAFRAKAKPKRTQKPEEPQQPWKKAYEGNHFRIWV